MSKWLTNERRFKEATEIEGHLFDHVIVYVYNHLPAYSPSRYDLRSRRRIVSLDFCSDLHTLFRGIEFYEAVA